MANREVLASPLAKFTDVQVRRESCQESKSLSDGQVNGLDMLKFCHIVVPNANK